MQEISKAFYGVHLSYTWLTTVLLEMTNRRHSQDLPDLIKQPPPPLTHRSRQKRCRENRTVRFKKLMILFLRIVTALYGDFIMIAN